MSIRSVHSARGHPAPHPRSCSPVRRKSQAAFPVLCPGGPLTAGRERTRPGKPRIACRFTVRIALGAWRSTGSGETGPAPARGQGLLSHPDHLSGPHDIAGRHPRIVTFPQVNPPMGDGKRPWPGVRHASVPANRRRLEAKSVAGEDNRANANARLIHAAAPGSRFPRGKCPNKVPPVPLFSVIVREHAYTGQFYHDVVEAGSCEQALHRATAPQLPPGSRQRSFSVTVTEHTYATSAGRFQDDFVEAGSCEQALHLAAARVRATARQRGPPQVRRRLGALPAALRAGAGTRSAAHGRRVGAGRPRPGARSARAGHRPWHAKLTARQVTGTVRQPCSW